MGVSECLSLDLQTSNRLLPQVQASGKRHTLVWCSAGTVFLWYGLPLVQCTSGTGYRWYSVPLVHWVRVTSGNPVYLWYTVPLVRVTSGTGYRWYSVQCTSGTLYLWYDSPPWSRALKRTPLDRPWGVLVQTDPGGPGSDRPWGSWFRPALFQTGPGGSWFRPAQGGPGSDRPWFRPALGGPGLPSLYAYDVLLMRSAPFGEAGR